MNTESEVAISVVTTSEPANYPFSVQIKNTENWCTQASTVSLKAAQDLAQSFQVRYAGLPVRIEHNAGGPQVTVILPKHTRREGYETPHDTALWTGASEPPEVGSRVFLRLNNIGPGVVTGYGVFEGYLGVMVQADEKTRPDWHKYQNPDNPSSVAFGVEIRAL